MQKNPLRHAHEASKHIRALLRQEIFSKRRQIPIQSYLLEYPSETRAQIQYSLSAPIPNPLPPLTELTISYYRRASVAVYQTTMNGQLSLHMLYESLWMLGEVESGLFCDYTSIAEHFELNLRSYMSVSAVQELVLIVAGNKALGWQEDIIGIVSEDAQQLWILVNHVYEKKISALRMLPFLAVDQQGIVLRALYEVTNESNNQWMAHIIEHQYVLQHLIQCLQHNSTQHLLHNNGTQHQQHANNSQIPEGNMEDNSIQGRKTKQQYALLIIGNLLAEGESYIEQLARYGILKQVSGLLLSRHTKDALWVLSNYILTTPTATEVLNHQITTEKLAKICRGGKLELRVELMHVYCHLATFGQPQSVYRVFGNELLFEHFSEYLRGEKELVVLTLNTIERLLRIGDEFTCQGEESIFKHWIKQMSVFEDGIVACSYNDDQQISEKSEMVLHCLEE